MTAHASGTWTQSAQELLVVMWVEGRSVRRIAEKLQESNLGNFSRGAVIGKARRLGLERRSKSRGRSKEKNDKPFADPGKPHRGCQWFDGPPSADDRKKCGEPVICRTAWCEEHYARVYGDPNWRMED